MGMTTTLLEYSPAQFRRSAARVDAGPWPHGLFADMADGAVVMQLFLNFTGFGWDETKLVARVVALCGEGGRAAEMFDEELAEHARCTDRTIRAWRKAYLVRAQTTRCSLLLVDEGSYNPERQRYERTRYTVPARVAELVGQAVAEARALPEYGKDRLGALEKAAGLAYDEIPDAPPMQRRRKPKKSYRSPVIQNIGNAARSLEKGKKALSEMPERQRAALLAGQGEELREMLLAMRDKIDEMLSALSETVDKADVDDTPENFSGIPPETAAATEGENRFRVEEDIDNTRKRPDEPEPEIEPTPEDVTAWNQLSERLAKPQVQTVEVELVNVDLPQEEPDPDEVAERAAILQFEAGFDRRQAEELAAAEGNEKDRPG